jgi:hypothetical protein
VKSTLVQTYALTVCFTTLMCFVVAFGVAAYDALELAAPSFTSNNGAWYSTTERYLRYFPDKQSLPAAEIEAARQLEMSINLEATGHAAWQSLVFCCIVLAIDAVVFVLHWWIAGGFARASQPALVSVSP